MTEDELVTAILVQVEDERLHSRVRILARALGETITMLTKEEFATELIRIRFALMRINGVLMSEQRPDHVLLMAQQLVDERIRDYVPEADGERT